MKKTKIIATLWPSSSTKKEIKELYNHWVNVVRLNYSHSNYDYFKKLINNVVELNKNGETNLSILTDTKWPEIRTKTIENKIDLNQGEIFILTTLSNEDNITNSKNRKVIVCDYEYIVNDLDIWHIIDIDTWLLKVKVIEKKEWELICEALNKHSIWSKRHLNLPGIKLHLPWITESDKSDIKFAVKHGTDFIALSFVRNKDNIIELKDYLKEIWADENIKIISKIENEEALLNIKEIIKESDGIMIARWDLWAEVPYETLPIIQRKIANKCKKYGKFFIVATQMLESMIINPIATRAEVTDIFNATMQKADATMLSWETAAWEFPLESVKTMKKVLIYSESQIEYKHEYYTKDIWKNESYKQLIKSTIITAEKQWAKNILVFTNTWFMARTIAAFRPNLWVFSFSYNEEIRKKLNILFGLENFIIEKKSCEENIEKAISILKEESKLKNWDKIVCLNWLEKPNWDIIPDIQVIEIK